MTDYERILEFFDAHETAIYGLGPTDYGAEEGTLLWAIKTLDEAHQMISSDPKKSIRKVMNFLIDLYEENEDDAEWVDKEVRGSMAPVCSRCGADSIYPTKYCGNCGKRMANGY